MKAYSTSCVRLRQLHNQFRIFFLWNGKKPNERAEASLVLKVASDEPGAYICPRHPDSEFSSSYHASTNKFIDNEFRWNFHYENGRCVEQFMDTNVELILRTRCITNQITKAVSYNYGRIYKMPFTGGWHGKGGIGLFYDFNPTPNDTNLEPKRWNGHGITKWWHIHTVYPNRWLQSDMKDVSYFFNFKFYLSRTRTRTCNLNSYFRSRTRTHHSN